MYVGFVAHELLGQSAAVRITGTQGFDGNFLGGNNLDELGVDGRILEWV
jgi:hypothetical protein